MRIVRVINHLYYYIDQHGHKSGSSNRTLYLYNEPSTVTVTVSLEPRLGRSTRARRPRGALAPVAAPPGSVQAWRGWLLDAGPLPASDHPPGRC